MTEDALLREGAGAPVGAAPFNCPDCGLRQWLPPLPRGNLAACPRCHGVLATRPSFSVDSLLAWAAATLILLIPANFLSLFSVGALGLTGQNWLFTGVTALAQQNYLPLGVLVGAFTILTPILYLGLLIWVLIGLRRSPRPVGLGKVFRWVEWLRAWAMPEIYLVGAFVAYSRLRELASVDVGLGGIAFALAAFAFLAIDVLLDRRLIWHSIGPRNVGREAIDGAIDCIECDLIVAGIEGDRCPRCGARLHRRKPNAAIRTAAFASAAAILYIPANVLPVLTVERFGRVEPNTIMSGVRELLAMGSWPLALIVLLASIVVPLVKLGSLGWFLFGLHRRSRRGLGFRTRLYRMVEGIGRWSNIDVFTISMLVALVQFGRLTQIEVGPAATAFGAVVVLTMLASRSFDPRLMWDAVEPQP